MKRVEFYFDYISPYSYLAFRQLSALPSRAELAFKPVVAGALMQAHQQKFPVEIPAKHDFVKRHCEYLARTRNTPFKLPAMHPFNSLALLRLTLLAQNARGVIDDCFRYVWAQGHIPEQETDFIQLVDRVADRINTPSKVLLEALKGDEVKDELKAQTQKAIDLGLFGVPCFIYDHQIYFGQDSLPMPIDALNGE